MTEETFASLPLYTAMHSVFASPPPGVNDADLAQYASIVKDMVMHIRVQSNAGLRFAQAMSNVPLTPATPATIQRHATARRVMQRALAEAGVHVAPAVSRWLERFLMLTWSTQVTGSEEEAVNVLVRILRLHAGGQ